MQNEENVKKASVKREFIKRVASDDEQKRRELLKRIARIRRLLEKKSAERVIDDGIMDKNLESSQKDYTLTSPGKVSGGFATEKDLESLKEQQLSKAHPSLRAEDVRKAFKKAVVLAWKRYARNLESGNPLKAAIYEKMVDLGITPRAAVMAIEAAFEETSDELIDAVVEKAEGFAEMEPEELSRLEEAVDVSFDLTLLPEGEVEGEWTVEESEEKEEEEEEEEEISDIEERLEKGSFRIPRVASVSKSEKMEDALIKQALPGYKVPE